MGLMRVKNESRWIGASLESQLAFCERVLVLDDHSTDDTREIVRSFGDRTVCVESGFEGVNEGRDKRFLLRHAIVANPEWVVWIDGDEVLESGAPAIFAEERMDPRMVAYFLPMLYFWDREDLVRVDGIYANIARASMFRVRGQRTEALFIPKGAGSADLHNNGNVPMGLCGHTARSRIRIKHYGYLERAERERKYAFYNRVDPNNASEDGYRHIIEIPGAAHAPGPAMLQRYREQGT